MTETSYFWSVPGIGDYQSSYSDDLFATIMSVIFGTNRGDALIAFQTRAVYDLEIVEASGGNFVLDAIFALVDGRFYENDASLTLVPASGNGYYAVVLRRDDSGGASTQTVRAALIYNAVAPPTPTQTAATWECVIAQGQVVAGVAQVDSIEAKPLASNLVLPVRMGDDKFDWASPGETPYIMDKPVIQVGAVAATALDYVMVSFPEMFKQYSTPLVFVTPYNLSGGTPAHSSVIWIYGVSESSFTIQTDDISGIEGFYWFAIGPEDEKRF